MKITYLDAPLLNYDWITYEELTQEIEDGFFVSKGQSCAAVLKDGALYYLDLWPEGSGIEHVVRETLNKHLWKGFVFQRTEDHVDYTFAYMIEDVNAEDEDVNDED
jgi:hypothetical protein